MSRTDLVFRSVGERTAELALELAVEMIRPQRVEVIDNVRPFAAAVDRQLAIDHDCDQVVHVDADCLILDDLVPFLATNNRPYVDCFVTDRFRGRIHCGVHLTRIDVVRQMNTIEPPLDDPAYVLRPESRLRNIALKALNKKKEFRDFNILHDHFQYYRDIYAKYALRELRSRTEHQRQRLSDAEETWTDDGSDLDVVVARLAIEHTRDRVPEGATAAEIAAYIEALPTTARDALHQAGIEEKGPMTRQELDRWLEGHPKERYGIGDRPRVFGIGLSRTGTRSLSMALHVLGWDTIHYPVDEQTFQQLSRGDYDLAILNEYHGITDITVAPYFAQLDRQFPGSKFILTVRDREPWLRSCRFHWEGRSAFNETTCAEEETYMNVRRLLRAAVYGCYSYNPERFAYVYDTHLRNVLEYFEDRPEDLLVLDICGAHGWEPLCEFLGTDVPAQPFPHRGAKLSKKVATAKERAAASTHPTPLPSRTSPESPGRAGPELKKNALAS